jgi:hypothetical protein
MYEKDTMNNRSAIASTAFLLTALAAPVLHGQASATLNVELSRPKAAVSPTLYGLMTEEINYSYDGGLYAEQVRNRTFRSDWSGILNWFLIEKGAASAKLSVDPKEGPSTALPSSAKLEIKKADSLCQTKCLEYGRLQCTQGLATTGVLFFERPLGRRVVHDHFQMFMRVLFRHFLASFLHLLPGGASIIPHAIQ